MSGKINTAMRVALLCVISLSIQILSCASAPPVLLTDKEYLKLKEAAGDNWDIFFEEDKITLTSRKIFYFYNAVSLPYMKPEELAAYAMESGRQDYLEIIMTFVPKWSDEKVTETRQKNAMVLKEQYDLVEKHGLTHLTRNKQNSFFPETPDDKPKIKKYEEEYAWLESQLIRVPSYKSEKFSIFVQDNRMGYEAAYSEEGAYFDPASVFALQEQ
ncbi:MAG: hypothetical protein JW969_09785 [Spirochaetales bacterium]|nr:hypothetical protein [Spirochaetales bacterium]